MSQLHLIQDNDVAQSFPLASGELLIGREEYCDIRLSYPGISRKHVRMLTVMDDTFLEDLASKNGTFVNGRLSRKCALNDGDIIQIGEIELRFERSSEDSGVWQADDPDATTVIRPGQFGPNSVAAREAGGDFNGISPVMERIAKTDDLRRSEMAEPVPVNTGWWGRFLGVLGLR